MPYRIDPNRPNVVQKKTPSGKWVTAPGGVHKTHKEAVAHLAALKENVKK